MGMGQSKALSGVIPALITPFDDSGAVDFGSLEKQTDYLCSAGVHGFFVAGTTAEGAYLSTAEKREIYKVVHEISGGRQFLCAAFLKPSTEMVIEEMRAFEDLGPDFAVAVVPFYMSAGQQDIGAHYRRIVRSACSPVIVYNIPSTTHNPIHLDTVLELSTVENIVGAKDSSGDFASFCRGVLHDRRGSFAWIQGEDTLDGASLLIGCQGVVTGLGNVRIEPYVEMFHAAQKNDVAAVRDCQKRINRLYEIIPGTDGRVIHAIKAGVALYGRGKRHMKNEYMTLSEEDASKVERILRESE